MIIFTFLILRFWLEETSLELTAYLPLVATVETTRVSNYAHVWISLMFE